MGDGTMLYHVGCGGSMITREQLAQSGPGGWACACRCGANAPILVADLNDATGAVEAMPASLGIGIAEGRHQLPHLEYYLGFFDFTCPAKEAWETALRVAGCVAFAECEEERCRREPERQRERARHFGHPKELIDA